MATITGKRFQITDGASTPTNLFPYTVAEAVYGLSNTISNAISTALSALSLSTYAGTSAIGSSTQPVYYNGSALVATDLSTTYAPYNANGYLPLTGGTMSNTNVVTNLNADLLDGYHETSFFRNKGNRGGIDFNTQYENGYEYVSGSASNGGTAYAILYTSVFGDAGVQVNWGRNTAMSYRNRISGNQWSSWRTVYDTANANLSTVAWACKTLTASGSATIVGNIAVGNGTADNFIYMRTADATLKIYPSVGLGEAYGKEAVAVQTAFDTQDPETSTLPSRYPQRAVLALQPSGGRVGIGTPTPSEKLHVVGNILATGAITAGSASDARLKTNIQSLSAEAAKRIVMALNPVTFTWNEKATELYDQYKGDDLGMIAQEVEPYLPQAVGTIFEKYKRLDYTKVISPLVKVAQDHETRLAQAEGRIAALERENAELRKEVERLRMN